MQTGPRTRRSLLLASLALLAVATPARGATATGTYVVDRPSAFLPAGHFGWDVSGAFLPELAEAPLVGLSNTDGLHDSDSRYVAAKLTSVTGETKVADCGDELGGTNMVTKQGVADPRATFEVDLDLNLLHGTGRATFSPGFGSYQYWAGQTFLDVHDTCNGQDETRHTPLDVLPHDSSPASPLTPDFADKARAIAWPVTRASRTSPWTAHRTKTVSTDFEDPHTIRVDVAFAGSPVGMHARCTMPTVKDLRRARTFAAARAVAARAGFGRVHTGSAFTRAASRGRFYIREGIGNAEPVACGYGGLHLMRSRGWPS